MKVVFVSFVYDESLASEEELIQKYYTTTGWAESLQKKGVEVAVVQRFSKENSFQTNQVQYHFIKDHFGSQLKPGQFPLKFIRKICKLDADIIHTHSTLQTLLLRFLLNRKTAIIIQHHGGPRPTGIRGFVYLLMDNFANGLFFTTIQQGKDWYRNKKLVNKIMPVMEGATIFKYDNRDIARKKTGVCGKPVFIWVGNLNVNKDPLTVLNGFIELLKKYQEAKLYLIYRDDILLNPIKEKVNANKALQKSITIVGEIAHEKMEMYFNSSDYFVLGSGYEGSGYALSEALACGCIPIVTDIPSFRMMTDNGRLGALWKAGDNASFVEAAILTMNKPLSDESKRCIDFFKKNLSFDAIAETAISHYKKTLQFRSRG